MPNRYKLQRDLPDYKAGAIFELYGTEKYRAIEPCENGERGIWPKRYVEDNPTWFEKIEDKIEVRMPMISEPTAGWSNYTYSFSTKEGIPHEKFPLIKETIERVLNDEYHNLNMQFLNKAREDAFNAGRKLNYLAQSFPPPYGYPTFQDYLNTLKERKRNDNRK